MPTPEAGQWGLRAGPTTNVGNNGERRYSDLIQQMGSKVEALSPASDLQKR
ncbi:hypothetical protein FRC08_009424 [Ceratobasidium sp. 394]|nr:hypothetical protein FRC08_009424 [Ceratobasidium sp. 394]